MVMEWWHGTQLLSCRGSLYYHALTTVLYQVVKVFIHQQYTDEVQLPSLEQIRCQISALIHVGMMLEGNTMIFYYTCQIYLCQNSYSSKQLSCSLIINHSFVACLLLSQKKSTVFVCFSGYHGQSPKSGFAAVRRVDPMGMAKRSPKSCSFLEIPNSRCLDVSGCRVVLFQQIVRYQPTPRFSLEIIYM